MDSPSTLCNWCVQPKHSRGFQSTGYNLKIGKRNAIMMVLHSQITSRLAWPSAAPSEPAPSPATWIEWTSWRGPCWRSLEHTAPQLSELSQVNQLNWQLRQVPPIERIESTEWNDRKLAKNPVTPMRMSSTNIWLKKSESTHSRQSFSLICFA